MAIDYNAGINSIDVGAHDITYSGNEGPKSPEQKQMMAFDDTPRFELKPLRDLIGEYEADHNGESPRSIDDLRRYFQNKYGPEGIAQVEQAVQREEQQAQMQQREGIQMASAADPMLEEEYQKYVFEMEEQGLQPMSLEEFRQQAVAGMATGGRVGYANGQLVKPTRHGVRPGYRGDAAYASKSEQSAKSRGGQGQTAKERGDTGPRDYGDGPKSEVAPPPYTPPTEKEIEKIFKEPTLKEKIKEKKDQYSDWYTKKQTDYLIKRKKKAIADRLNNYLKSKAYAEWMGDDFEDWKKDWPKGFTADMSLKELEQGIEDLTPSNRDLKGYTQEYLKLDGTKLKHKKPPLLNWSGKPQEPWQDYPGSAPGVLGAATKFLGAKHFSDEHGNRLLNEIREIQESGDMNWLERMKKFSPNQYAIYTGQNASRDPRTGQFTFTPRSDDQGGNQGVMQTAALPATTAAATQAATPGAIATGPITFAGGIDPAHQAILKNIYGGTLPTMFAADGGRAGYAGGGIADLRQGYFLGKIVKSLTKPFKGVSKSLRKLTKSKAGKLAMLAMLGHGTGMFGSGTGSSWLKNLWAGKPKWDPSGTARSGGLWNWIKKHPFESIAGFSALGGLTADEDDDKSLGYDWEAKKAADEYWDPRFNESNFRRIEFSADGGRIGYNEGGNDEDHRSDALTELYKPRMMAQEGGLMDLGGMEKDYRNEGGFVPIGGQERADDVPARLSKNEFVFTAEAVRNAGGGDIDKGAEIMENLMENLEKGGNVSEESQGLEGARDMFATSQRLEGVL